MESCWHCPIDVHNRRHTHVQHSCSLSCLHHRGAASSHQIFLWSEDVKPHEIHRRTLHQYGDACTDKRRELAFFSLLITHHHTVAASLDTIQKWDSRSYSILHTALILLPLIMYSGWRHNQKHFLMGWWSWCNSVSNVLKSQTASYFDL